MCVVDLGRRCHRLAVRHLGRANFALDVKLALHAIDDDLKVELAHALDHSLARLFITGETERRVLGGELDKGVSHLILLLLGSRLHSNLDDRLREVHLLEDNRLLGVTEGIAGGGVLQADERDDITRNSAVDVSAVDGVHLEQAANALFLALHRVEDTGALVQDTRVNASKRKRTDEGVVHDLECKGGEGLRVRRLTLHRRIVLGVHALDSRDVERRRHVVDNGIEKRLDAFVLESSAKNNRGVNLSQAALADDRLETLLRQLLALEVGLHRLVISLDSKLDQLLTVLLGLLLHVIRNVHVVELGACSQALIVHTSALL